MNRPKTGTTTNGKIGSKTISNIESTNTSSYQITKKHDKNKKQIELKSKIDIPINDHNRKKTEQKSIYLKDDSQNKIIYVQPREESKKENKSSKSKEKGHKKTLSEVPKTISNLDTSEQEDEDDALFSVSYNNKLLNNKNNKYMNLKKKNDPLTYENDSLFEENIKKSKANNSKTDVINNQNKKISPLKTNKKMTSEYVSNEKTDNLVTDDAFTKDQSNNFNLISFSLFKFA